MIKVKEIRSWTKREQEKEIKKLWRCVVGLRGLLKWAVDIELVTAFILRPTEDKEEATATAFKQ